MSEIGWYKSRIRLAKVSAYASNIEANPSYIIMKRSFEMASQDHGGVLTDFVVDSSGRKTNCDLALKAPNFPHGVGLRINSGSGEVEFLYEQYGEHTSEARNVTEEITQNYVSIALIRAMKALGYAVEEDASSSKETVVIVGQSRR